MSNLELDKQSDSNNSENFVQNLTTLVEKLRYPSESDEKIKVIDWQADNPPPFDVLLLKKYLGLTPKDTIFQKKWEDFFEPIITLQDWYTEIETKRAADFQKVRDLVVANLEHLQYFQVGKVEIEAYLIGKDKEGKWKGLKTLIIHT